MNLHLNTSLKRRYKFLLKYFTRYITTQYVSNVLGQSNKIDAVYVINLDRQLERWKQMQNETKRQKVTGGTKLSDYCHRVPAVDGKILILDKVLPEEIITKYHIKDQYNIDPDPRLLSIIRNREVFIEMSNEEIAVAQSHINTWKKIVNEKRKYALILEDDVFFENKFAENLDLIWAELPKNSEHSPKFDILYLSYQEVERGAEKIKFSKRIMQPIRGLWWLSGYVLSYEGAQKLLSMLPVKGPVDLWMNQQFSNLNVYMSESSIIFQRNDLKSNNSYSILPLLSQIGIQSDKTHLDLQKLKGINPVFVLSQNSESDNMINTVLSMLGYRCCVDKWGVLSRSILKLIDAQDPLLFDAYIGISCLQDKYELLEQIYPDAFFILFLDNNDTNVYQQNVLKYFEDKKQKFLAINSSSINNWKIITKPLGCKAPNVGFPHNTNHTPTYQIGLKSSPAVSNYVTKYLEHDVTPWIIPIERMSAFGITLSTSSNNSQGYYFKEVFVDDFHIQNDTRWVQLENSFPSNLATFTKENFKLAQPKGFEMVLSKQETTSRKYASASIESKETFLFGRFDIVMKVAKLEGTITAFFLHRNDPWQEIDFEFLGKDTNKMLINVYYNPGYNQSGSNFGNRGTPILIDLDFDASVDFHKYSIEWEPHEIRWFVDNKLVHVRGTWEPTPIPDLPMKFYVNFWPSRSEELVGTICDKYLPASAYVKSITIHSWEIEQ